MKSFCFILPLLLLFSCQPTEPINMLPDPNAAEMRATINGESFLVTGVQVTATISEPGAGVRALAIGGATLPLSSLVKGIALALVSIDSTDFEAGETYLASSIEMTGAGEYVLDDDAGIDIKAVSSETGVATITLTAFDRTHKLVSGTFSFDGVDEDDPNTTYEVRDGSFTNVPF